MLYLVVQSGRADLQACYMSVVLFYRYKETNLGWPINQLFISWSRISAQIGQVVLFYWYWFLFTGLAISDARAPESLKNLMQNKGFGKSFSKCHSSRGFKRSNLAPCPKSECSTALKRGRKGKCNANGRPPPPNR